VLGGEKGGRGEGNIYPLVRGQPRHQSARYHIDDVFFGDVKGPYSRPYNFIRLKRPHGKMETGGGKKRDKIEPPSSWKAEAIGKKKTKIGLH